ncbi:MAG TPA: MBL fold metallo-hydrolase [Methanobacteriaceae archaeon]|nr:MBL fold metallo-hydrolase [Methanobacteriaceae archaeon]
MKIKPLAFESLGVRSMATWVETDQKIIIDPGTSLAPKRFGYPPWKTEFDCLHQTRATIQDHARKADIITISHYHHDHYTPFSLGKLLDSHPKYAEEIYQNKKLFIKHPTQNINKSQQKRASDLLSNLKEIDSEVNYADGQTFQVGETNLKFSPALPHGSFGSRLGYVIIITVKWDNQILVHASDAQGPIYTGTKDYILGENPDILIISGPPTYLAGFALEEKDIDNSRINLEELSQEIPKIIVDHHLLRDLKYLKFIDSIKTPNEIIVASKLLNKEPNLLEARRKQLFFQK